jgi:hypothetical protein
MKKGPAEWPVPSFFWRVTEKLAIRLSCKHDRYGEQDKQ